MSFGSVIRELRKSKKLTQVEVAKIFQISNGTIAMWETDKRQPDQLTLSKLADFFGVSVDYLLERDSDSSAELPPKDKELIEAISALTDSEVDEMINYLDFILSKRKKSEDV